MSEQEKLANRIKALCKKKDISYYTLSYRSAVPMTTLMHIISLKDFFDSPEFLEIEVGEE